MLIAFHASTTVCLRRHCFTVAAIDSVTFARVRPPHLFAVASLLLDMALDVPMGALLPADAVADILFNIGDSETRAAFRVSCRFWMNVGENVRAIVELRCPDERVHSAWFRRLSFWSPWVGDRIIYEPDVRLQPMVYAHWQAHFGRQPDRHFDAAHGGWCVRIHMCSDAKILHCCWYRRTWRPRHEVYNL